MEKERFFEILKETDCYTDQEIEDLWNSRPQDLDEEKLIKHNRAFSGIPLAEQRLQHIFYKVLTEYQEEKQKKLYGK